jgi:release factor glutamine methyltransferase
VFHPRFFLSRECFAEFIGGLDLTGKRVVDVGTGSGILALPAARAGAQTVTATDINPNAALNAAENARANGLGDRVTAVCTNLLSALAPRPLFDVTLSSRPNTRVSRAISPIVVGTRAQPTATSPHYSTSLVNA